MSHKILKKSSDSDIIKYINQSLDLLKTGKIEDALIYFDEILKMHYTNSVAETGIKCCKYWIHRIPKIIILKDGYEKGILIINEWNKFEVFIKTIKNIQEKVVSCLMFYIFSLALESFKKEFTENKIIDIQRSFLIALTYKKIGDYQNAIKYFEEIILIDRNNSNALAELADCYALIDEIKKAKVLFREAFFIDPSSIDLDQLESEMILTLISKIEEKKILKNEIKYWIPVYGRVFGIFNVFRELIPIELGKLKQEIFFLEKNYNNLDIDNLIKARLLNCYLWIYDYNFLKNYNQETFIKTEEKIREISEEIYNLLKNIQENQ